jgi:ribosomal protein S12 methylthiotransferase
MEVQAAISASRLAAKVGRTLDVLVDTRDSGIAIARSSADAPEIDGVVRIADAGRLTPGQFARVRVVAAGEHDLEAQLAA